MLSNNSDPLPSPPDIGNPYLPYANMETVNISQLSPRQSLVTPLDNKDTYGGCTASGFITFDLLGTCMKFTGVKDT